MKFDDFAEKRVKLIAFPLPPVSVRGLIFMPDSFASTIEDYKYESGNGSFKVVTVKMTSYGPALLCYTKLRSLISVEEDGLKVHMAAICASVSLKVWKGETSEFAVLTTLDQVNPRSRSCHPGSHFVIPFAPYLTACLQYAQAPTISPEFFTKPEKIDKHLDKLEDFTYVSPIGAESVFDYCDFTSNAGVDKFVSTCRLSLSVLATQVDGLGKWGVPLLAEMRRNWLKEDEDVGRQTEVPVDAVQEGDGE